MTDNQKVTILENLIEYSSYFASHPYDDEHYGLRKETVVLLAKTFFPENPLIKPPFNRALFETITHLANEEIQFIQNPNQRPANLPPSNIPDNLKDFILDLDKLKRDNDTLNKLQAGTYFNWEQVRLATLRAQTEKSIQKTEEKISANIFNSLPTPTLVLSDAQNNLEFTKSLTEKISQKIKEQADKSQEINLGFIPQAITEWEQALPEKLTIEQKNELAETIKSQKELPNLYALQNTFMFQLDQAHYDAGLQQDIVDQMILDGLTREEAILELAPKLEEEKILYRKEVLSYAQKQLNTLVENSINQAVQKLGGENTTESKILLNDSPKIKEDLFRIIAYPEQNFCLENEDTLKSNVQSKIIEIARLSVFTSPHWFQRKNVNIAIKELENALNVNLEVNPAIPLVVSELNAQNKILVQEIQIHPDEAQGTAFESVFSFILAPDTKKLTDALVGFLTDTPTHITAAFGGLSPEMRLLIYTAKPEDQDEVFRRLTSSKKLTPEQQTQIWDFTQRFKSFSEDHELLSKLTRLSAAYKYAKMDLKGQIFLGILPNLGLAIVKHPEESGRYIEAYSKEIIKSIVKFKVIRPVVNKIGVAIGTHEVDTATNFIRFKPALLIQRAIGKFTKKVVAQIGSLLPAAAFSALKTTFNTFRLIWDIAGGLVRKVIKYASIALGGFLYWIFLHYGIGGIIMSGIGSLIGAYLGFGIGGPIGALIGFFVGGFLGGIATIVLSKVFGGLQGFASTLLSSFSLPTLPAITLPSLAGLAVPIVGTFLTTVSAIVFIELSALTTFFEPYISRVFNTGSIPMSKDLDELFQQAADEACVPVAALKAISQIEASGIWSFSKEEIQKFSTSNWWTNATQEELKKGYCTDTCLKASCGYIDRTKGIYCSKSQISDPTFSCQETTVYGPMQFEELTWKNRVGGDLMERCNLEKSVKEAAKKIKEASGDPQQCNGNSYQGKWNETTMKNVARSYCGSCGAVDCSLIDLQCRTNNPCGANYCQTAWTLYQAYERR